MKKMLLMLLFLPLIAGCRSQTVTDSVVYEVKTTRSNVKIEYRNINGDGEFENSLTTFRLPNNTEYWTKHIIPVWGGKNEKPSKNYELIVTSEGEGEIFVGMRAEGPFENDEYKYYVSNSTRSGYIKIEKEVAGDYTSIGLNP